MLLMRKNNTEAVSDLVRACLRNVGLETPLNEYRLLQAWPEIAGAKVAKYTGKTYIFKQALHVELKSSVLRNELMMCRQELVEKLNAKVGAQVISNIVFH